MDALDAKSELIDLATKVLEFSNVYEALQDSELDGESSLLLGKQLQSRRCEMLQLAYKALASVAPPPQTEK